MRLQKHFRALLLGALGVLAGALAFGADSASSPALDSGFQQMYNLDFRAAHAAFLAYQQAHPNDPMGHVSNAAAYLFSEFDRLHILESDLFVDDQKFEKRDKPNPDPRVKAAFENELALSNDMAERALAKDPRDRNALFAQVLANGLRGDFTAMIERRNLASLGYMKTSRTLAQALLAVDPTCYDAYLAIGAENYLLGINPAPVRWLLQLTGAQANKAEGLQHLRLAAEKGHYLAPFARLLLAVAALRDKDPQTARLLLAGLATQFPGNQLYARELSKLN